MQIVGQIIGWCCVILVGLILTINAAFMLVSPRAWFRLPDWLRAQGTLTEDRYATGWGAIQLRLTGAGMLAAIAWVLYDMLCWLQFSYDKKGMSVIEIVNWCLAISVGLIMAINAVFMLFSPHAWFRRLPGWLRAQGSFTEDRLATHWGVIHVRLTGAMILAAIVWVLYEILLGWE
jgi:hypothetical protein